MGIVELFEIGFFSAFYRWSVPVLTALVYLCVFAGAALQFVLEKRCRRPAMRWLIVGLCGIGAVVSECLWQAVSGWDRLGIDILYGFVLCVLLGAAAVKLAFALKNAGR